jgi:hypothetical protein
MKEKSGKKIFLTRRRPNDVSYTRMLLYSLIGFTGLHCFHVGRRVRGWFMVCCSVIGFLTLFVPKAWRDYFMQYKLFGDVPTGFPTDYVFLLGVIIWAFDVLAIAVGIFKYPIRLGEGNVKTK